LRNPSGHRFVEYGPEQAFELVCFVNFLLGFLRQTVRSQKTVRFVGSAMDRYILADLDGDGIEEKLIVTLPGGGENQHEQLS
jgi:hypothetical protein